MTVSKGKGKRKKYKAGQERPRPNQEKGKRQSEKVQTPTRDANPVFFYFFLFTSSLLTPAASGIATLPVGGRCRGNQNRGRPAPSPDRWLSPGRRPRRNPGPVGKGSPCARFPRRAACAARLPRNCGGPASRDCVA